MMEEYEPFRARSNTWPLPRPDIEDDFALMDPSPEGEDLLHETPDNNNFNTNLCHLEGAVVIPTTAHEVLSQQQASQQHEHHEHHEHNTSPTSSVNGSHQHLNKKNTSRRNAWGNMSYADLITQAIQGSPDKRLTLSQIYEWMVQNVSYFKDKGDSNSSAGWKNSIRHNLSLHNRFMRVQNEGTGKSSWWMINPDAKPGKAARRRATSMETSKFEKKRGRVKKKLEALRNGIQIPETHSPSSSVSEGLDHFDESPLHQFNLSPDFRPRASSNASSCGRLSPIPAVEADMHDSQVPPLSPLNVWNSSEVNRAAIYHSDMEPYTDQLVDMANTLKLGNQHHVFVGLKSSPTSQLSPASSQLTLTPSSAGGYSSGYGSSLGNNSFINSNSGSLSRNGSDPYFQSSAGIESSITLTSLNAPSSSSAGKSPQRQSPFLIEQVSSTGFNLTNLSPSLSPAQSLDILTPSPASLGGGNRMEPVKNHSRLPFPRLPAPTKGILSCPGFNHVSPDVILSRPIAVAVKTEGIHAQSCSSHIPVSSSGVQSNPLGSSASQVMGHLLSLNNSLPQDLDFDSLQGGLECDVNSVIQHELNVDGNLDFNFDPLHAANSGGGSAATSMATSSSHSWVH